MRSDFDYLEFIAESIQLVLDYTRSGKDHFLADVGNQDQVLRRMEVLADATDKLSQEVRTRTPRLNGMRLQAFAIAWPTAT